MAKFWNEWFNTGSGYVMAGKIKENVVNVLSMGNSGEFNYIVFDEYANAVVTDTNPVGVGKAF
jgi:hypothetical protein